MPRFEWLVSGHAKHCTDQLYVDLETNDWTSQVFPGVLRLLLYASGAAK